MSDDGSQGISIIAFVGSVFSPYYAWSGYRDPEDHCAINVALYGKPGYRWTMTERRRTNVCRAPERFEIGPSNLAWDGETLTIAIDEVAVPLPRAVRGVVRVRPGHQTAQPFYLHSSRRHRWWPIAPCARVEVEMSTPGVSWSGSGYLDTNEGDAPVQHDFVRWDWSRAHRDDGSTAVLYDVTERVGAQATDGPQLALHCEPSGNVTPFAPPRRYALPKCAWGVERNIQSEPGEAPRVVRTLEDSPFYTRSVVATQLLGERAHAMHESLSCDRFASKIVRLMLPFRMPRALP